MMNLTQVLHRNVQQCATQPAVCFRDSVWTYTELQERVQRVAGALQSLGVEAGDRVAILSLNSSCYIEYLLAVPWAGGVLNPVNTRWSASEIAYSLRDSDTRVLIVDDTFASLVPAIKEQAQLLEHIVYCGDGHTPEGLLNYESLLNTADPVADANRGGDDLAGIFYTGGTTGFPKGVMLSHTNLLSSAVCFALSSGVPRGTKMLHAAPMFHLADLASVMLAFMQGGTQVIVPAFDPTVVSDAIKAHQVTDTLLVPTMVQMLFDDSSFDASKLASLERLIYGASPMPIATLDRVEKELPSLGLIQAYGMTELAPVITVSPADNHTAEARASGRIRSAGLAGALQEIRIVDEQGNELPRGEVGEIIARGPNVMQGYWGKPEQTAEAVVDGWMHTGDGGYMDDEGYIFVVDRVKDMIISGGENIYSAEVESVVSQHPDVAQCAVIGIPSEQWGESVHVVIVPAVSSSEITVEGLRDFCRQHIAGYKCPRSFSLAESLPLSGAGKILKTELRKPYWEKQGAGVA